MSGSGRAVVVQTGANTVFGAIAERLKLRPPETEFERGLRLFGGLLIQITLLLVLAIFGINVYLHRPVVDSFLFALALAVGLTPELLPAIVSLTLARGAQQMAASHVIVRRLNSIEDFGSMNVLCSDKTGTLTEKGVVRLHAALDTDGNASDDVLLFAQLNAVFESGFPNPIDDALRHLPCPTLEAYAKVDEVPYDFIRKRLSVVVRRTATSDGTDRHTMITKGALRNVLAACADARTLPASGVARTVSIDEVRGALQERFEAFSEQGYRVLGVAIRDVTEDPIINKDDERQMSFIGFLLLEDPPKAGALEAIAELEQLGVALRIITGDNRLVAARIGRYMGVERPSVLTGDALLALSDMALMQRAGEVDIFAEIEPNQKERIMQRSGRPATWSATWATGSTTPGRSTPPMSGSPSRAPWTSPRRRPTSSCLERDLDVLAQGVEEGRQTFANTLKYVFMTTSANFGNMFSMAGASLFLPFLPLLPKQILLNNFLSDMPAMTIATDDVDREWMERPRRWDIRYVRNFMMVFGLVSSVFDYLTFGALLWWVRRRRRSSGRGGLSSRCMTELAVALVVRTRPVLPQPAGHPAALGDARRRRHDGLPALLAAGAAVWLRAAAAAVPPAAARHYRRLSRGKQDGQGVVLPAIHLKDVLVAGHRACRRSSPTGSASSLFGEGAAHASRGLRRLRRPPAPRRRAAGELPRMEANEQPSSAAIKVDGVELQHRTLDERRKLLPCAERRQCRRPDTQCGAVPQPVRRA